MEDFQEPANDSIHPMLVDAKTIARALSVTPRYVHMLAEQGEIPVCRFGKRCIRFNLSAVLEAIGAGKAFGRNEIT